MTKKIKKLLFDDNLEEPVVELSRINYKSSGICLYLPKRIDASLHLDKNCNKSLILIGVDSNCMFLIKDTSLAAILKCRILELRKKALYGLKKEVKSEQDLKFK